METSDECAPAVIPDQLHYIDGIQLVEGFFRQIKPEIYWNVQQRKKFELHRLISM